MCTSVSLSSCPDAVGAQPRMSRDCSPIHVTALHMAAVPCQADQPDLASHLPRKPIGLHRRQSRFLMTEMAAPHGPKSHSA